MSTPPPPPPYEPGPPPDEPVRAASHPAPPAYPTPPAYQPTPPAYRPPARDSGGPAPEYRPPAPGHGSPTPTYRAGPPASAPAFPPNVPQASPEPSRPPRSRLALWLSLGGGAAILVLVAVVIALQVSAGGAYDAALETWRDATDETSAAQAALAAEATTDADAVTSAQAIVAAAPDGLVDTAARDGLAGAATTLGESVTAATDAADATVPDSPGARPTAFWELFGAAAALRDEVADLEGERAGLSDASDRLTTDADALDTSADDLFLSVDTAGPAYEAAHVNARNAEVIAFRDAQEAVSESFGVGADSLDAMTAYAAAAGAVVSSEQEEIASISDGLYGSRLAAQDFARSIDGGVLVEFDWAPIVYGAGEGGSVGGYTTWNYDHGGHALISLSNSVAELWPADVTLNLIAHEVGHAISAKCPDLYDDTDQASIESFATAWAIGMGYTGDGNGVSLYGQPSPELIASAATCR